MKCPKCNCENVTIINEVTTEGKDYSAKKGCCWFILLGPIGLLCGACGKGKQTINTQYCICQECGEKWKL